MAKPDPIEELLKQILAELQEIREQLEWQSRKMQDSGVHPL